MRPSKEIRVLGVDPGTLVLGYGMLILEEGQYRPGESGTVRSRGERLGRLQRIYDGLREVFRITEPDIVAMEAGFAGGNPNTALALGESRGVVVAAAAAARVGVVQYSPGEIKSAVVGNGRAHKSQVQFMVRALLELPQIPRPTDIADAFAAAICHCHRVKG